MSEKVGETPRLLDIVERLRFDAARCELQFSKGVAGNIEEAAAEIARLRKLLSAAGGYLMNAKIDLETNATKRTAIRTIEGGIKMIEAALKQTSAEREAP